MSRPNLARLGGLAAIIGGTLYVAIGSLNLVVFSGTLPPVAVGLLAPVSSLASIVVSLLFAVGLVGLYALLGRRSWLGISGLLLAFSSVLAAVSQVVLPVASLLFADLGGPTPWLISAREAISLIRGLLLGCGVLLLSVAAFKTRTLVRWVILPPFMSALTLTAPQFSAAVLYFGLALGSWTTILHMLSLLLGLC